MKHQTIAGCTAFKFFKHLKLKNKQLQEPQSVINNNSEILRKTIYNYTKITPTVNYIWHNTFSLRLWTLAFVAARSLLRLRTQSSISEAPCCLLLCQFFVQTLCQMLGFVSTDGMSTSMTPKQFIQNFLNMNSNKCFTLQVSDHQFSYSYKRLRYQVHPEFQIQMLISQFQCWERFVLMGVPHQQLFPLLRLYTGCQLPQELQLQLYWSSKYKERYRTTAYLFQIVIIIQQ